MSVALSPEFKQALIDRCNPHCIAWARATASLWGMSRDHDLDEPVKLSDEVPVRLRYSEPHHIITDRTLSLKSERAGTHIAIRFFFKDGSFHESELIGVPHMNFGETATVRAL